ncbi:hypothetical protein [Chitinophaga flava]|uniref:Uncharacterized protein n=1 Tax=Chitinophaga flava TaxID=2259036 RepID=A0A365XVQ4_9BACT|nr:hypothetical protein [Chitinophaga flava]RBL90456.1 hypothetical protein DF182_28770 [Chitinophaga flava]
MSIINQKIQEVTNELKAWLDKPNAENLHFHEPTAELQTVLTEPKVRKSIMVAIKNINTWYGINYVYQGLADNAISKQNEYFVSSYYVASIANAFALGYPANPPKLQFTVITKFLANTLQAKWYDKSNELINMINKWLPTKFLNGGLDFAKASWFILTIANKCFDIKVDYSAYRIPKTLGIYDEILTKWDTSDLKEVDRLINVMCDYHINEAGFNEETPNEFSLEEEFVYTYEIAAWLSVREKIGLKNPEIFSHPIAQLIINKLPIQALPFHPIPSFDTLLQKLKHEFPDEQ